MEMVVFVIWIALTPWILLYGAYEGPKVFWFWMGGFFLTIRWLFTLVKSKKVFLSTPGSWLLAWVAVLSVASAIGIHPLDSFVGGGYRHQGVLFFFTLFLVAETLRLLTVKYKRLLVYMIGAGVVLESMVVIFQKLLALYERPLGSLGEPNAVSGFLAIGLFWVFRMTHIPGRLRGVLGMVVLAAIVATESRTGLAVAVIVCAAAGIRQLLSVKQKVAKWFVVISGLLITGIACGIFMAWIVVKRPVSNYESRPLFWKLGMRALAARPILGYGAESEEAVYDYEFKRMNVRLIDLAIDRSHNMFLDVALWSGLIGLVVFTGWLVDIGRGFVKTGDSRRMMVFLAWMVFAGFQPMGVVHWMQLVLLASLI